VHKCGHSIKKFTGSRAGQAHGAPPKTRREATGERQVLGFKLLYVSKTTRGTWTNPIFFGGTLHIYQDGITALPYPKLALPKTMPPFGPRTPTFGYSGLRRRAAFPVTPTLKTPVPGFAKTLHHRRSASFGIFGLLYRSSSRSVVSRPLWSCLTFLVLGRT